MGALGTAAASAAPLPLNLPAPRASSCWVILRMLMRTEHPGWCCCGTGKQQSPWGAAGRRWEVGSRWVGELWGQIVGLGFILDVWAMQRWH